MYLEVSSGVQGFLKVFFLIIYLMSLNLIIHTTKIFQEVQTCFLSVKVKANIAWRSSPRLKTKRDLSQTFAIIYLNSVQY